MGDRPADVILPAKPIVRYDKNRQVERGRQTSTVPLRQDAVYSYLLNRTGQLNECLMVWKDDSAGSAYRI